MEPVVMNDTIKDTMDYVNTLPNDCIVSMWSYGHIYQYYTDKKVLFRASSHTYKEQLDYLVYGNKTSDCVYIWNSLDIKGFDYMVKYGNVPFINTSDYYINKITPDKVFNNSKEIYYVKAGVI